MKLKATKNLIFKLNETLKETAFDEEVEIKINSVRRSVLIGRFDSKKEFEHVKLKYKFESVRELKYLYHIKILGPGLKYEYMAYAKATWLQHMQIMFVISFMKLINLKNITKLVTIFSLIYAIMSSGNTNVYVVNPSEEIVITDTIYNDSILSDTLYNSPVVSDTIKHIKDTSKTDIKKL